MCSSEERQLKIHFAASGVNPTGWEGLLGIPTLKQISEMTVRNPIVKCLFGHGSFPYCKADLLNGIYFAKFHNSWRVDDTCIPEGLSSTFLNANSTLQNQPNKTSKDFTSNMHKPKNSTLKKCLSGSLLSSYDTPFIEEMPGSLQREQMLLWQ